MDNKELKEYLELVNENTMTLEQAIELVGKEGYTKPKESTEFDVFMRQNHNEEYLNVFRYYQAGLSGSVPDYAANAFDKISKASHRISVNGKTLAITRVIQKLSLYLTSELGVSLSLGDGKSSDDVKSLSVDEGLSYLEGLEEILTDLVEYISCMKDSHSVYQARERSVSQVYRHANNLVQAKNYELAQARAVAKDPEKLFKEESKYFQDFYMETLGKSPEEQLALKEKYEQDKQEREALRTQGIDYFAHLEAERSEARDKVRRQATNDVRDENGQKPSIYVNRGRGEEATSVKITKEMQDAGVTEENIATSDNPLAPSVSPHKEVDVLNGKQAVSEERVIALVEAGLPESKEEFKGNKKALLDTLYRPSNSSLIHDLGLPSSKGNAQKEFDKNALLDTIYKDVL